MTQPAFLIGKRFGKLQVIQDLPSKVHICQDGRKRSFRVVECKCDCGKTVAVTSGHLTSGNTKSCGCGKYGHKKHGGYGTDEHVIWTGIKNRCNNKRHPQYNHYGGRGITICEEWNKSFECFVNDMGPRPSKRHSIDRIDNSKGYYKSNCRWATREQQSRNRRVTFKVIYEGKEIALADVAEITGQSYRRLYHRLRLGWTIEEALKYKRHAKRKYQKPQ